MSLLAACTVTPSRPPPMPPAPPMQVLQKQRPLPPQPPYRRSVPRPARKPLPPPEPAATAVAQSVARTPPASPPPAGELIGLDRSKAVRLFGERAEKSAQPPATVWRYRTPSCELDLFFYLDLRSGQMRTLHYAFKGDVGSAEKRQDCLRAIVAARAS